MQILPPAAFITVSGTSEILTTLVILFSAFVQLMCSSTRYTCLQHTHTHIYTRARKPRGTYVTTLRIQQYEFQNMYLVATQGIHTRTHHFMLAPSAEHIVSYLL